MSANAMILLAFTCFFVKHYVVDFLLQPPWMFRNKHILFHPGGLAHACLHGFVTTNLLLVFAYFGVTGQYSPDYAVLFAVALGMVEFGVHYLIDYAKMNITLHYRWGANTHQQFWYALGCDQLFHYLTYVGILWYWFQ